MIVDRTGPTMMGGSGKETIGLAIAIAGPKGGTGKTTTATGLAVYTNRHGWDVQLVDLDIVQASSIGWGKRRVMFKHHPPVEVVPMRPDKVKSEILQARQAVDLLVLDLPGRADILAREVAEAVDLMVVISDSNVLELDPTIALLDILKANGHAAPHVVVALSKVRDEGREAEARKYLKAHGYDALPCVMWDYTSVHDVIDDGRTAGELSYPDVLSSSRGFYEGIMKALERALSARVAVAEKHPAKARQR